MTKSLRQALEEALVENPDDPAAHAAYADHLIEQGDPRGEFVRVQVALEDEKHPAAERKKLRRREQSLLKAHQREWLGELAPFLLDNETIPDWLPSLYQLDRMGEWRFRRGWLDQLHLHHLSLPFARALKRAAQTRLVRELFIDSTSQYDTGEAILPEDNVPEREFCTGLCPLVGSPHLTNVRRLRLGFEPSSDEYPSFHCHFHSTVAVNLVRGVPRVEELYLFANDFDPAELFGLRTLENLRVLQLYHGKQVHRLQVLAENPRLRNLTHLLIHPHHLSWWECRRVDEPDGYREQEGYLPLSVVRPLLHSRNLPSLAYLRLRCSSMGDEGCREIVRSGILKRLKMLDLRHGCITDEGARVLAEAPDVKRLEYLDLDRNGLSAEGIGLIRSLGIPCRVDDQQTEAELHPTEQYARPQYLCEGEFE